MHRLKLRVRVTARVMHRVRVSRAGARVTITIKLTSNRRKRARQRQQCAEMSDVSTNTKRDTLQSMTKTLDPLTIFRLGGEAHARFSRSHEK
jgi:hypothetical protein